MVPGAGLDLCCGTVSARGAAADAAGTTVRRDRDCVPRLGSTVDGIAALQVIAGLSNACFCERCGAASLVERILTNRREDVDEHDRLVEHGCAVAHVRREMESRDDESGTRGLGDRDLGLGISFHERPSDLSDIDRREMAERV